MNRLHIQHENNHVVIRQQEETLLETVVPSFLSSIYRQADTTFLFLLGLLVKASFCMFHFSCSHTRSLFDPTR